MNWGAATRLAGGSSVALPSLPRIHSSKDRARRLFDGMTQGEVKVYRRRRSRQSPVTGIDALPDEVLQHVLGFLPAQEAVRTCVLAWRWRYLWRSVSALRVTSTDFVEQSTKQEFSALNKFVNNLLLLRDPKAPLDFCEFLIRPSGVFYGVEPDVSSWIAQALMRYARIIRVHNYDIEHGIGLWVDDLHFISQHLTTLELNFVEVTGDFSSCVVLKNLRMMRCNINKLLCQSVRQLTLTECLFLCNDRVRISAPSVVWLELSDSYYKTPLLENMPSLVNAFIRLHFSDDCCGKEEFGDSCSNSRCENCADNSDATKDCVILKGLSNAESLELIAEPRTFIFRKDLTWCPSFSKLKTLLLNEWCVAIDFHALVCFLHHAPILEKLTLQLAKAPKNWVEAEGTYNPSKRSFASKKLKVVEVKCQKFDKRVQKIFMILSKYSLWIEHINVQRTSRCSECFSFQTNADIPW